jgi:putative NADH-flavin reductase
VNIVIFGASGGTGQELIRQSLEAGHTVTAVVRKADSVATRPRLTVLTGDVYVSEDVAKMLCWLCWERGRWARTTFWK